MKKFKLMTLKFLDRIIYPEIHIDGFEELYQSMKSNYTYSNFGPLSIKLQNDVHREIKLSDNFQILPVVNGGIGINVFGYLLKQLKKSKHIVISDIGFASQWQFVNEFFDKISIVPTNENYYLDADKTYELVGNEECDVIYITATYGQDVSSEIKKLRQHFPSSYIIADYANALFSADIIEDEKILYMTSLHATKLFGIGEGGLIFFDTKWLEQIKKIMNFGLAKGCEVEMNGTNAKMSEFASAIALINLPFIKEKQAKLNHLKSIYESCLKDQEIKVIGQSTTMLKFSDDEQKNKTASLLMKSNVATHTMYLSAIPKWLLNSDQVNILGEYLPLREKSLGVPFHTLLTEEHIQYITSIIKGETK